jgi:PAS domain S-box-containing protein
MSDQSQAVPAHEVRAASLGLDFYRLVESASDLILIVRDGNIVYANPAFARTLGYAPEELVGRPPAEIVHPDERAASRARVEQALREGAAPLVERRLRCRDGSVVTIEGSAFATTFEGSPAVVLMGHDLSDRKRAEEERRRSQADFRALVDAIPGFVAVHAEGRFLYVNAAAAAGLGYSPEELLGRPLIDFMPEHHRAEFQERLAMPRPPEGTFERDFVRSDGSRRLLTLATILCTFEGRAARLTLGFDSTDRVKAEEALAASNAALQRAAAEWQTTFDTVDAAIAVLDASTGEVVRMNHAAQVLLGGTSARRPLRELVASEPWRTAAQLLPRVLKDRSPALEQVRLDRKVWLVSLSPVESWPGSGAAVIVLARDVTPLVELQDSLRRSEAMSAIGSLVAGVAHEVRNPLFGMSATLDAMDSRLGPVPGAEPFLQILRRELDRLNTLMRDLLDYGKPPGAQLSREPLAPVIAAALRACAASAQQRHIHLDNAVGAEAGEVSMDAARIAQVLQNLVENAIQHTPPGGEVRVEAGSGDLAGSPSVEVRVLDGGHGFRLDDLPRIFEPFFTRRRGGTGLGLSIVQRITEQHGGIVEVGNRPEGGAVVTVRLPRDPPFIPAGG